MVGIASNAVPHYYYLKPSIDKLIQDEIELSYKLTEFLIDELLYDFIQSKLLESRIMALNQLKNWMDHSSVRLAIEIKARLDKNETIRIKCREILSNFSEKLP